MKTILITGPIGSGKSEVARILEEYGCPVYISDRRTKSLYDSVPGLKDRIETILQLPFERWDEVFVRRELLSKLEALVYPYVLNDFDLWRKSQRSGVVFMESAVAGSKPFFKDLFDEIWLVRSSDDNRHLRSSKSLLREDLQLFDNLNPSFVIDNDGTISELQETITKHLKYEN